MSYLNDVQSGENSDCGDYALIGMVAAVFGLVLLLTGILIHDETLSETENTVFRTGAVVTGGLLLASALWFAFLACWAYMGEKTRHKDEVNDLKHRLMVAERNARANLHVDVEPDPLRRLTINPR